MLRQVAAASRLLGNVVPRPVHLVWLKRDLRRADHAPLTAAVEAAGGDGGVVVPLFVAEPEVIGAADYAPRHWTHVAESLRELRADGGGGLPVVVRHGEVTAAFEELDPAAVYAHEETGNGVTFERDKRVLAWCRDRRVPITEFESNGVQRRSGGRDAGGGWAKRRNQRMKVPPLPAVDVPKHRVRLGKVPGHADVGLAADDRPAEWRTVAGEAAGRRALSSFLAERGQRYHEQISSPLTAWDGGSRLSVALAYGNLSVRQCDHALRRRLDELPDGDEGELWRRALRTFDARLHWHCHFIQKLEDQPSVEHAPYVPDYDDIGRHGPEHPHFAAYAEGRTGFPMVDACMRCLRASGWINFRMRAMLVSFASYDLWLDWRATGLLLARLFADYEPGIHWPQVQMQSGTTGINTLRIYNPDKQREDHDPDEVFVRRWIEEYDTPDYPERIVDHRAAAAYAKETIYALRRKTRDKAEAVLKKHGSRKRPPKRRQVKV